MLIFNKRIILYCAVAHCVIINFRPISAFFCNSRTTCEKVFFYFFDGVCFSVRASLRARANLGPLSNNLVTNTICPTQLTLRVFRLLKSVHWSLINWQLRSDDIDQLFLPELLSRHLCPQASPASISAVEMQQYVLWWDAAMDGWDVPLCTRVSCTNAMDGWDAALFAPVDAQWLGWRGWLDCW